MKRVVTSTLALAAAFAITGAITGAASAQDIKLGYINKMGDHPWFVSEVQGPRTRPRNSARRS